MNTTRWSLLGGTAAGAAAMFLLDPALGRRRRSLVRDQLARTASRTRNTVRPAAADVYNRTYGTLVGAKARFRADDDPSDTKVVARVRSVLGRVVSHPRALEVTVSEGCVTLSGPILADEESSAIKRASHVRGVRGVVSRLEVHDQPDDVPALQGRTRLASRSGVTGTRSPAASLISSLAGALLGLYGAQRRGIRGFALAAVGLGLVARAATNVDAKRLTGALADPEWRAAFSGTEKEPYGAARPVA